MSAEDRFQIKEIEPSPEWLRQGCSTGGAILAKREFAKEQKDSEGTSRAEQKPSKPVVSQG